MKRRLVIVLDENDATDDLYAAVSDAVAELAEGYDMAYDAPTYSELALAKPTPEGHRRVTIRTYARADVDETWTVDVPDALIVGAELEAGDYDTDQLDPDIAAEVLGWTSDPRTTFVTVDDDVTGGEGDRELAGVQWWDTTAAEAAAS